MIETLSPGTLFHLAVIYLVVTNIAFSFIKPYLVSGVKTSSLSVGLMFHERYLLKFKNDAKMGQSGGKTGPGIACPVSCVVF